MGFGTRHISGGPIQHAYDVVPSDDVDLPNLPQKLYIGRGGDLRIQLLSGDIITLYYLENSTEVELPVVRVFEEGTTCDKIVALV